MLLRAGQVQVYYDQGFLRYITIHQTEAVRMIYFAVRDRNWDTIPLVISQENIKQSETSFHITYKAEVKQESFQMDWQVVIEGLPDGNITYAIEGIVGQSFFKNRIGLCVLHPIEGLADKICQLVHPDGSSSQAHFPSLISPHQPFKNIRSMQWQAGDAYTLRLDFEGDIFETEDQRNWADASYKTYCTPVEIPFPVEVQAGTKVSQRCTFQVLKNKIPAIAADNLDTAIIQLAGKAVSFPGIGLGVNAEGIELGKEELRLLQNIGLSHLRADIFLSKPRWELKLENAVQQSNELQIPLELALFFSENPAEEVSLFLQQLQAHRVKITSILLFEQYSRLTTNNLLDKVLIIIRQALPDVQIGGGTDANFAEFNRNPLNFTLIDFVAYAVNPQAHASDDLTIIENAAAHADTVISAQALSSRKPVHVSPVTLKPRFNIVSTTEQSQSVPLSDYRQAGHFAATWTLGSLKYLSEAGVSAVTFYETTGERGICSGDKLFPVGQLLESVLKFAPQEIQPTTCSNPLKVSSLLLKNKEASCLWLANHTKKEQLVQLPTHFISGQINLISSEVYQQLLFSDIAESLLTIPPLAVTAILILKT